MFKRIRELREDNDIRQKDIADLLHITQSAYSYIENGQRKLTADELKILALFYKVSADYILEISNIEH